MPDIASYDTEIYRSTNLNAFMVVDDSQNKMTVMIMRAGKYASEGGIKESGSADSLSFADASSISDWAVKDIIAAVRAGIVNGRTANTFAPQDQATRAEAAVMMKRLLLD